MYKKLILSAIAICFGIIYTNAQTIENDTTDVKKKGIGKRFIEYFENSNKVDTSKKFDFSIIGGPHYSGDTKLGLGMVAAGLYRVDRSDMEMSPSNVSLYADITTSGAYVIGIEGNTLFRKMKHRIDADLYFSHRPTKYWGVGYDAGKQDHYSEYNRQTIELKFDFLEKIAKNAYVGASVNVKDIKGQKFEDITLLGGANPNTLAVGVGAILTYDSRDFIPNPYKGIYAKAEFLYYPKALGSTDQFNRTELTFRYYQRVWKGGILAYDALGVFNNGDVSWNMMALSGNSRQMRGYYNGRYRDKNMVQSQVELRQRVYRRNGVAVWAGAGNVFSKFSSFEWAQTLPTWGVGYRWEFKKRMNVRLDYGIGKGESSFYFNVSEAF